MKSKTFLSHNSKDKPVVERIARWLENEAKIPVWLDKWNLIPGDKWLKEIGKALDESQCCVVFFGPHGIGKWHDEEMLSTIISMVSEKSIRVIPALLPGADRPEKESKLPRFLRGLTWVNFKNGWNDPGALHRLECGIKEEKPGRDYMDIEEGICPFRGLEIFREQDRRFFFGRDRLVERLLDKLEDSRFLAVTGPSGSGKSSIVQAGLISYLRQHSQVVLFKPGERPLEELAFALRRCFPEEKTPPVEQLRERLERAGDILHLIAREISEFWDKKKLLVVIDQFEELFTQVRSEEERRSFISLLLGAVDVVKGPVSVILTLRSDFIGKCAYYKDLNMFVNDNFVQVEPMDMEEIGLAVEEPARMVGLCFEEGLVNRILEDVKGAPGELPLLEHALLELYECRDGNRLTLRAYDEIGGISGALANRAESEFSKLDDEGKEILRKMFVLRLIQPGEGTEDTRRRATKEELLSIGGDVVTVEKVINRWIDARLLTASRDTSRDIVMVDVAHEALIRKWDRIREWMAEGREAARLTGILRQAALEWRRNDGEPGFLFQEARLVQMEELAETHAGDLTNDEMEFIQAGIKLRETKEREKEEQQQRELQAAQELAETRTKAVKRARTIIVVVFFSLLAVTYLFYNSNLNEKKARRQLAVNYWDNARQAREKDQRLLSMHLWAEALSVNPNREFQKILLTDMNYYWNRLPLQQVFQHERAVLGATFNSKQTRILTWSEDQTARLWDAGTGKPIGQPMIHKNSVHGATFNADETRILTWSSDGTTRLWDAETGKPIGQPMVHKYSVNGATFTADETRILTLSGGLFDGSGAARLWDVETGKPIGQPMEHEGSVYGATFNADETRILTWSYDNTARLWDAETGKPIRQPMVHKDRVWGATFTADGTRILTWSYDNTARLWDAETGKPIGQPMVHKNSVRGATFTADETRILTWSFDNTARLWDAETGKPIGQPMAHKDLVRGATFNADETRILTWSGGLFGGSGAARLWDAETGQPIGQPMEHEGAVRGATFNADETRILTWSGEFLGKSGAARLWDAETGQPIGQPMEHEGFVYGATFNADETRIFTWSSDGTTRLWDAETGKPTGQSMEHEDDVNGATFNADETRILTWSFDNTARLWDAETGKPIGQPMEHEDDVNGATFNADETRILIWSSDNTARLWDAETGKPIGQPMEHEDDVNGATFNADETRILTWSFDYTARLWDAETGKPIGQPMVHKSWVNGATFNADETRILTWSSDNTARLWDAETGKPIGQPMEHEEEVNGATFNADETRILTWSGGLFEGSGVARLWDAETGKPIGQPMVHKSWVNGATFNADETRILTWSSDNTARLWDAETGKPIGQPMVHKNSVYGATFNADETRILTWSSDNTARLWDAETGKPIGQPMVHKGWVNGATFNADETRILTWSNDGTVRLWDIAVDWDYPKEKIKLQVMALTGTRFNKTTMETEALEPDEWRKIKKEYMDFAKEHYKNCKYPRGNVFRKLFPKEAAKVKKKSLTEFAEDTEKNNNLSQGCRGAVPIAPGISHAAHRPDHDAPKPPLYQKKGSRHRPTDAYIPSGKWAPPIP